MGGGDCVRSVMSTGAGGAKGEGNGGQLAYFLMSGWAKGEEKGGTNADFLVSCWSYLGKSFAMLLFLGGRGILVYACLGF